MLQWIVVDALVACSLVYALWSLSPKAPRGRLAAALLKLPHPHWLDKTLLAAVKQQGGCGCDGCDGSAAKTPAQETQPLVFQPRSKR